MTGKKEGIFFMVVLGGLIALISAKHLQQDQNLITDKFLVQVEAEDILKAEWSNAEGRKETLSKEGLLWYYAGMEALDSARSTQYFAQLVKVMGNEISARKNVEGLEWKEILILYGTHMSAPVKLAAYVDPDKRHSWLIHSSVNPGHIFISDSSGIYREIFGDLRQFWPDGQ